VTGGGDGEEAGPVEGEPVADAEALGEALGELLWRAWPDGEPPHEAAIAATMSSVAALPGAETWGRVPIDVTNDILRTRLRFRYHPPSEAGRRPHPQDSESERVYEADGACCPFCFIWIGGIDSSTEFERGFVPYRLKS
jgi:hypothetical protein